MVFIHAKLAHYYTQQNNGLIFMPSFQEQLWLEALYFHVVCPILVNVLSQERFEEISLNLAQIYTWTQG